MADVTREEFDALVARVDALDGGVPVSPPPPPPVTIPLVVSATVTDSTALVVWSPLQDSRGLPTSYLVGRSGTDTMGSGPWSTVDAGSVRSRSFDKLLPNTGYQFDVTANYADGSTYKVSVLATTKSVVVVSPPPPAASGLLVKWPSGVWMDQDAAGATKFGTDRGQAINNVVVFTSRANWNDNLGGWWRDGVPAGFTGDVVVKLPLWTEDGATGTQKNWQDLAAQISAVDDDAFICLGWEMNMGAKGSGWGWQLTAANQTTWESRYRQDVSWMLAVAPKLRFIWNPNSGTDQPGGNHRAAFQRLKDLHVGYGIDSYDAWPVDNNASGRNTHLTATGYLGESYNYAIANGMQFHLPEWGVYSGTQWGTQGGDNPQYIDDYMNFLKSKQDLTVKLARTGATVPTIGGESYFYEPSSYLRSDFTSNPKSGAAYKKQFTG